MKRWLLIQRLMCYATSVVREFCFWVSWIVIRKWIRCRFCNRYLDWLMRWLNRWKWMNKRWGLIWLIVVSWWLISYSKLCKSCWGFIAVSCCVVIHCWLHCSYWSLLLFVNWKSYVLDLRLTLCSLLNFCRIISSSNCLNSSIINNLILFNLQICQVWSMS